MKHFINSVHPQLRTWLWFGVLWFGGLISAILIALPVKILIHFLKS